MASQFNADSYYETCSIALDFGENIDPLKPHAADFVEAALKGAGANFGNFSQWKMELGEKQIRLSGKLTPSIMNRIFSLNTLAVVTGQSGLSVTETDSTDVQVDPPVETQAGNTQRETSRPSAKERLAQNKLKRQAKNSLRYFKSINDMLSDIGIGNASNTLTDDALWVSNYSRTILSASTSSVDPELVQYGNYVARQLDNIVANLHNTQGRIVRQQLDMVGGVGDVEVTAIPTRRYNYGGHISHRYAPMYRRNVHVGSAQENIEIEDYEIDRTNNIANGILNQIAQEHQRVRQDMIQKYGIQF